MQDQDIIAVELARQLTLLLRRPAGTRLRPIATRCYFRTYNCGGILITAPNWRAFLELRLHLDQLLLTLETSVQPEGALPTGPLQTPLADPDCLEQARTWAQQRLDWLSQEPRRPKLMSQRKLITELHQDGSITDHIC